MKDVDGQLVPAETIQAMGADAARVVLTLPVEQQAVVVAQVRDQVKQLEAIKVTWSPWHDGFMAAIRAAEQPAAVRPSTCPGCSGSGVLTDDPQVLKCTSCGGIFTDAEQPITPEQAIKFVAIHLPMLANAGTDGSFFFDLELIGGRMDGRRVHGWADRRTKRVVQWG